jgi:hypothetical protein
MPKHVAKAWGPVTFNAASLVAVPQQMLFGQEPGGIPHPCFMIEISNDSNTAVDIRYQNDYFQTQHVRANTDQNLNFQGNKQPNSSVCLLPQGTTFWISGTAGVGIIYITCYYVEQS